MSVGLIARSIWTNPGNRGRRLRKAVSAAQWQLQKRLAPSVRRLRLPNGLWFNAYPDCVVSSALIYSDWPEYGALMFVRGNLRRGDVVIDVGANVGHISLLVADLVGADSVFAFEPAPGAFRRLKENWNLNGFATDGLSEIALGASRADVFIEAHDRPTTTLCVSKAGAGHCTRVPQIPLDDCRHQWTSRTIGFLKIDVEGYEPEVFEGSRRVLTGDRPRLIMFESLGGALDPCVHRILADHDYTLFQLDEHGRPDSSRLSAQNLFARPNEHCTVALKD
jgi:FkbM family methyltransferase